MSRLARTLTVFLLLLAAAEAVVPADALLERLKPNGFVNDFAGILNPQQRDALEQRVRTLQQRTGAELAVVIIKSLEGGEIDDFTNKLFNRWGVGQQGKNNGVMLLVALDDRKLRIEVGYGLEPVLPDVLAGRIIDEDLRPPFRESRYVDGLNRGVERIAGLIERGEPASRLALRLGQLYHRSKEPLGAQLGMTAFFALFVGIGLFMAGAAIGVKQVFLVLWGAFFGGIPMVMAFGFGGLAPMVLVPLGVCMFVVGLRTGRKHPRMLQSSGTCSRRAGGGWEWGASSGGGSGGFSSSDSGGFSGGSSGGGGASGSW